MKETDDKTADMGKVSVEIRGNSYVGPEEAATGTGYLPAGIVDED